MDPEEARKLERWIRRKYEHKEFALGTEYEYEEVVDPKTGVAKKVVRTKPDGTLCIKKTSAVPEPKVLVQAGRVPLKE